MRNATTSRSLAALATTRLGGIGSFRIAAKALALYFRPGFALHRPSLRPPRVAPPSLAPPGVARPNTARLNMARPIMARSTSAGFFTPALRRAWKLENPRAKTPQDAARWLFLLALFGLSVTNAGCGRGYGHVELDWVVVDRDLRALFPKSGRSSTCNMEGVGPDGQSVVRYDLQVRLRAFACQTGESIAQCQARPPARSELFACNRARGSVLGLPAREAPYLFIVDTRMKAPGYGEWTPRQSCVAHAGPRNRRIRAGKMTNLLVYQFVVQSSDEVPLAIPSCVNSQVQEGMSSGVSSPGATTSAASTSEATLFW